MRTWQSVGQFNLFIYRCSYQVLVVSGGKGLLKDKMALLNELWAGDINAETVYKNNPKLLQQFQKCETEGWGEFHSCYILLGNIINSP